LRAAQGENGLEKRVIPAVLTLALFLLTPMAANAAATKASVKMTDSPYSVVGFAVFNSPSGVDVNFVLQVSLKDVKPNMDYYVYLYDYNSGKYLFYLWPDPGGILHTNQVGNGNFHLNDHLEPGTYNLRLWINEEPTGHSYFGTDYVQITIS